MEESNKSIVTFLTLLTLNFFLLPALKFFWEETALTSVYVINRLPSQVIHNVSPFVRLYGTFLSYSNFKVFGCVCFMLYILMNIPNLNHMLVYVVSWVMVLNIKDFIVGIPSLNDYVYLTMSPFRKILCFLVFLHFMHLYLVLTHSS